MRMLVSSRILRRNQGFFGNSECLHKTLWNPDCCGVKYFFGAFSL